MNSRLELHIAISAALGLVTGMCFPDPPFMPLVPVALFFMLWPAMLDLDLAGLRGLYQRPGALFLSLLLNFLLSPLLIYALSLLLLSDAPSGLLTGVLLFGLVPCGGMAPAYTGMLQGSVGLAVSIAATSLILSIGMTPLWTELLIGRLVDVPVGLAARSMALTVLLPMFFARVVRNSIIRRKGPDAYRAWMPSLKKVSGYGLMLLAFAIFAMNGRQVVQDPPIMLRISLVSFLFLTTLLIGALAFGRMARLQPADLTALAMSSATKNNAIAITLALMLFGAQAALAIAVAGPMVQIPVMLGFQRWYRQN